jgi:hypothetical protein
MYIHLTQYPFESHTYHNKTDDIYYDMYGIQMDIGLDGYTFTIPSIVYNKQAFVPDGQNIEFTWTWSTSASVDQDGVSGTLYSGEPINTADVSGSYFVENTNIDCDNYQNPEECPDE